MNCSASPNCTSLNRDFCYKTAGTCGKCLPGHTGKNLTPLSADPLIIISPLPSSVPLNCASPLTPLSSLFFLDRYRWRLQRSLPQKHFILVELPSPRHHHLCSEQRLSVRSVHEQSVRHSDTKVSNKQTRYDSVQIIAIILGTQTVKAPSDILF